MTDAVAGERTRDRMIRIARELFAKHSYEGASLQMIASAAGVTKPAISYHFRTKEELLAAVAAPAFDDLRAYFDALDTRHSKAAQRRQAVSGYVDLLVKHRELMFLLVEDPGAAASPVIHDRMTAFSDELRRLFVTQWTDLAEQVHVTVALGGLRDAAASFPEVPDDDLRLYLKAAADRMLARPLRRGRTPASVEH